MNFLHAKKFRYGSISLALTIVIIAAVILFNAIFGALTKKFLWYIDMTPEQIYSLSDEARDLLDRHYRSVYTACTKGAVAVADTAYFKPSFDKENQLVGYTQADITPGTELSGYYTRRESPEVTIIFCSEKDVLEANTTQRYVLYTALELAKAYPTIKVRYVDVYTNPSEVNKYKETSGQTITSQSVIVTSGTESRVYTLGALFTYSSDNTQVLGYNGEQRLISAILAVTRVESPVVCVTTNHGEMDALKADPAIVNLLVETGYTYQPIDLTKDEIPADCRLLLIYDPQSDFRVKSGISDISELEKIDAFLDANNSVMVFVDYETPYLPNLEAFLEEWGIKIARKGEVPYLIQDPSVSLDASGYNVKGQYVEAGLGASITAQLRRAEHPKSVIFPMTTAFVNPESYEEIYDETSGVWSSTYFRNGVSRDSYNVFLSSADAKAQVGGVTEVAASDIGGEQAFSYMKVTSETVSSDDSDPTYSYVFACASTGFASSTALDSGYGNHAVIAYACNVLGRAVISVSLDCKYFNDNDINSITAKAANQYTIVLTAVPAGLIFIAGVYVMIRRKYA